MTITAWRIVKAGYTAKAFDGEGARLDGGRWNSPGVPVVYTSGSAALATLEMLVHLGRRGILGAYVLIGCSFDETLVSHLDPKRLPKNWRTYPAPPAVQALGDEWARSGSSAVLQVPSVVIPTEVNYVLNPRHPEFERMHVLSPQPFEIDARLRDD